MKTIVALLIGVATVVLPLSAEQTQPAVKRHPGFSVHYKVKLEDGDVDKVTSVNIALYSATPIPTNQPGLSNGFNVPCIKSSTPAVWECSTPIPDSASSGDYTVNYVTLIAGSINKRIEGNFHVPLVTIENPATFNPPKVTVTEQP